MYELLANNLKSLWGTAKNILPIMSFLLIVKVFILKKPIEDLNTFLIGIILTIVGLHLFLQGASISLLAFGEEIGMELPTMGKKWMILLFAFVLGYFGTLVEPALRALAMEVEEISVGAIPQNVLINAVAIGFGGGMALGIFKIINNVPTIKIVVPLLTIAIIMCFFVPRQFIDIAIDTASATTGPVNIPLNMALALGIAKILENVDPLLSGFGIVGLTSLGAVVSVLVLGLMTKIL